MPITLNLNGVEAWKGGAMLPVGTHSVRCIDAEEGRSKGGHYELHLTWEAPSGEHAGGQIQDWVQVTETTYGKVRQLLEACQVQVPAGEFSLEPKMLLGTTCSVVVREKAKPDGMLRAEIVAYNPAVKGSDVPGAQSGEFVHAGNSSNQADDPPPF